MLNRKLFTWAAVLIKHTPQGSNNYEHEVKCFWGPGSAYDESMKRQGDGGVAEAVARAAAAMLNARAKLAGRGDKERYEPITAHLLEPEAA